ncbi:unnamed protein product [Ectocarpus sp. 6 AP-2014]
MSSFQWKRTPRLEILDRRSPSTTLLVSPCRERMSARRGRRMNARAPVDYVSEGNFYHDGMYLTATAAYKKKKRSENDSPMRRCLER